MATFHIYYTHNFNVKYFKADNGTFEVVYNKTFMEIDQRKLKKNKINKKNIIIIIIFCCWLGDELSRRRQIMVTSWATSYLVAGSQ